MGGDFKESDWKVFRELRETALERFCYRTLTELESVCKENSKTGYERYLAAYELLQKRDKKVSHMFDAPRRSEMLWQLKLIYNERLLEETELMRFSEEVQKLLAS